MFPSFLPSQVTQLTEPTSIALAQALEQSPIATSLSPQPISTSYGRQGTGNRPILLLHGFDSSVFEFRRLLPLLAAEHETWAIDLLGFGFTDRSADIPVNAETITTHLYYAWKTLINQPVILVGASMGGAVAIDFSLNHPEAVQQLVLIDSAGIMEGPRLTNPLLLPLVHLGTEFLRNPRVRRQISLNAYVDPSFVSEDALTCAALHLQQVGSREAMVTFTRSGGYPSVVNRISQIQQPTLILWGDGDRILGRTDAEKFKTAIARSQLIWLKQCGHVPHLEDPPSVAHHILEFARS